MDVRTQLAALARLLELLDAGVISEDEYDAAVDELADAGEGDNAP
jgi:hypothetical protein